MAELSGFLILAGVIIIAATLLPGWLRRREQWREVFYGWGEQGAKAQVILQALRERGLRAKIRHMGGLGNVQALGRRYSSVRVHQDDAPEAMRVMRDLGLRA